MRKLNPPRLWLSSQKEKRCRALQEPITSENIETFVERDRSADLFELIIRQESISEEGMLRPSIKQSGYELTSRSVFMNHLMMLKQLKARNAGGTSSSSQSSTEQQAESEHVEIENTERMLRVLNLASVYNGGRSEDLTGTFYTESLGENETFLHAIDVDQTQNFDESGGIDSAHLIENITDLEESGMSGTSMRTRGELIFADGDQ